MSDLRKAAEMALEVLEEINKLSIGENAVFLPGEIDGAMEALRQALAQPEQVLTAKVVVTGREWVGLTDEEGAEIWGDAHDLDWKRTVTPKEIVKRIEAKLKEKNT